MGKEPLGVAYFFPAYRTTNNFRRQIMDAVLSGFITKTSALIGNEQNVITSIQALDGSNQSLSEANGLLQDTNASLQKQTGDLQAAAAAAQKRLGLASRVANVALALHRLPFVTDPNARPILEWFQPSNSGNTGGASSAAHGTWSITDNPDGSRDFNIRPVAAFDDYIWGLNHHTQALPLRHAVQLTEFEVADEDLPNLTGIETNFEHSISLTRRNAGIQALLGTDKDAITGALVTNQWRWFDIGAGHWFDTGIPFDRTMFGTGKHIELISEFVENADGSMTNLNLTINGKAFSLNKTSKPKATTWGPYLQQGWQMDPLKPLSMKTKVWNMETYWS
jgi:hypothetical protein